MYYVPVRLRLYSTILFVFFIITFRIFNIGIDKSSTRAMGFAKKKRKKYSCIFKKTATLYYYSIIIPFRQYIISYTHVRIYKYTFITDSHHHPSLPSLERTSAGGNRKNRVFELFPSHLIFYFCYSFISPPPPPPSFSPLFYLCLTSGG